MKDAEIIKKAEKTLGKILKFLEIQTKVKVSMEVDESDEKYLSAVIEGDNLGYLIGYRGTTLNSFQKIFNIIISCEVGEPIKVLVDVNSYRQRRKEYLKSLAQRAVQEALESDQNIELQPLSAFERRVIHMVLKDEKGIMTESEGEGEDRHIVIKIDKKESKKAS